MNIITFFFIAILGLDSNLGETYIQKFAPIAIEEMHRSGIPASIKLAQGMLESDYGRSNLATVANNHFGIKCGSTWTGETFYKEDDDFSADGTLTKSCFRAFKDAESSYMSHSDFIKDPKKSSRYGHLFSLPISDYMGWAHGLKNSGYATDPSYPQKLIYIIEKYDLSRFDDSSITSLPDPVASNENKETKDLTNPTSSKLIKKYETSKGETPSKKLTFDYIQGKRYAMITSQIDAEALARISGTSLDKILSYNDHIDFPKDKLSLNVPVFFEEKSRDYEGQSKFHIVKEGESLEIISQLYGIRVGTLQNLNRLGKNALPLVGEKIFLKDKVKNNQRPKFTRKPKKEFIF